MKYFEYDLNKPTTKYLNIDAIESFEIIEKPDRKMSIIYLASGRQIKLDDPEDIKCFEDAFKKVK